DRDQGDARPVRRRAARDRGGGAQRPRPGARGPPHDAACPPRRDARGAPAGAALAARKTLESWRIRLSFVDFAGVRRYPTRHVSVLNTKVLVLNRSYLPIHITVVRRALSLLYQGIAHAGGSGHAARPAAAAAAVDAVHDGDLQPASLQGVDALSERGGCGVLEYGAGGGVALGGANPGCDGRAAAGEGPGCGSSRSS